MKLGEPRRTDLKPDPLHLHPATVSKQNRTCPKPKPSIAIAELTFFSIDTPENAEMSSKETSKSKDKDKSKVHKLSLKGSARLVAEFVRLQSRFPVCEGLLMVRAYSSNTLFTAFCMETLSVKAEDVY